MLKTVTTKPVLSREQWQFMCESFATWLRLRAKHEPRFAKVLEMAPEQAAGQLAVDIDHSALLYRMLVEGKEPLPEPPPLRYSYPDYPD